MNNRIYVVCEGKSENHFITSILNPWFYEKTDYHCHLIPYTVITSRDKRAGKVYRGGIDSYKRVKRDMLFCMSYDCPVSSMIDLFRLPHDFPGRKEAENISDDVKRVELLERKMKEDLMEVQSSFRTDYLLPYISLHEFETLFYCDLNALKYMYLEQYEQEKIDQLIQDVSGLEPEEINQGPETAPSKRLLQAIHYEKGSDVIYPLSKIGVEKMMQKCPHFKRWVEGLLAVS